MIFLVLFFIFSNILAYDKPTEKSVKTSEFTIAKPKVTPVNNKKLKEKLVQEAAEFLKTKNSLDIYLVKTEKAVLELLESGLDDNFKNHEIKNLKKMLIEIEDLNNSIKSLTHKVKDHAVAMNDALCQNKSVSK